MADQTSVADALRDALRGEFQPKFEARQETQPSHPLWQAVKRCGTRLWLDYQLRSLGVESAQIRGYTREVSTHSQVAEAVLQGEADFGVGVLAAARKSNLDFIPLFAERFDLVIPDEHYQSALLLPALDHLNTAAFRHAVESLGGYDPQETGKETRLP